MNRFECRFEEQVLLAVECRAERTIAPELAAHIASCPVCSSLAAAVEAFDGARDSLAAAAELPSAARVWRQAQIRARQDAIRTAGRPITAAQLLAFGAAMSLIGAYFGATSSGFQSALAWAGSHWPAVDVTRWLASASAFVASHALYIAGLAGAVLLLPAAVYFAVSRD